tara:strand:- start:11407 stop:11568 length:162 start_codon:yes stop_codon:yes gene_type:complete
MRGQDSVVSFPRIVLKSEDMGIHQAKDDGSGYPVSPNLFGLSRVVSWIWSETF